MTAPDGTPSTGPRPSPDTRDGVGGATTAPPAPADLAGAYAELQNLLLDRADVSAFLEQAARLAAEVAPEASCSVTLRRNQEVTTAATSDAFAVQVDEIQYGRGQGPCLQSMRTAEPVDVADLAADDRWGEYRIHALTFGVQSSLSFPLIIDDQSRGALNIYGRRPRAFDGPLAGRLRDFSRQLSTALTLVLRSADQAALEQQLREAITGRAVIDQAVGIIMGQRRIAAAEAFAVLREVSQTRNRKLRLVAADLVESVTGRPPATPRPFTDRRG